MSSIKKFFGLILFFCGLIIIFYSLYSSYGIFTARKEAPAVFEIAEQSITGSKGEIFDVQGQLRNAIQEQFENVLPAESVINLFNLISWSIFAGILILGGGQVASLGIKLSK